MVNKSANQNNNWSRRVVAYHIYPRSFKDSNGDGIGDLKGIIEKLDYLNDGTEKSLGVGAIWLSPIYKSPMADFGYDVSDYTNIDPIFGNLEDFDELLKEAHKRGIKVIMDFVPNHTSDQHPWFLESRSSRNNPKRDWYIWKDPKPNGSPPNNWLSVFGGSAWEYDKKTKQFYLHKFLKEQPDLNWRNPEVKEAMFNVMRFWINRGVDGFRADAVIHLIKDKELRDDPPNPAYIAGKDDPYDSLLHIYSEVSQETIETTKSFCQVLDEHQDKFLVSEVYLDVPGMMKYYHSCRDGLHAPFNFNLMSLPWDAGMYKKFINEFENSLGPGDWPNYVLSNHDRPRLASRIGRNRARLAAMLLLTLRGLPFIYYGDEIGMKDVNIPPEKTKDPREKLTPGLGPSRDPERSPMQWNGGKNAGFSGGEPWLPVSEDYKEYNVEKESLDPNSMLNLYRRLIHYRNTSPALLKGKYVPIDSGCRDIFAFLRECDDEKLLILLNFSNKEQKASFGFNKAEIILNTYLDEDAGKKVDLNDFSLRPDEGYVLRLS